MRCAARLPLLRLLRSGVAVDTVLHGSLGFKDELHVSRIGRYDALENTIVDCGLLVVHQL